jgi:hypothetical protein
MAKHKLGKGLEWGFDSLPEDHLTRRNVMICPHRHVTDYDTVCPQCVEKLEADLAERKKIIEFCRDRIEELEKEIKWLKCLLSKCATVIRTLGCEPSLEVKKAIGDE